MSYLRAWKIALLGYFARYAWQASIALRKLCSVRFLLASAYAVFIASCSDRTSL